MKYDPKDIADIRSECNGFSMDTARHIFWNRRMDKMIDSAASIDDVREILREFRIRVAGGE